MDKVINKAKLDELINMVRAYYHDADFDTAEERCRKYLQFAQRHFEERWLAVVDFLQSVFPVAGFKPDATNEDIYKVLDVLGWVVKE